jgi:hemolysin III
MDNSGELINWEEEENTEAFELELIDFFSDLPQRSHLEEKLNAWSHGIFAVISIFGFLYVLTESFGNPKEYAVISAIIYGMSLIFLFASSAVYHNATNLQLKKKLRIMDHCAIFLFIVGNYAPLLLLTIGGSTGVSMLMMLSSAAFIGILLKMKFTGKYDWFFVFLYVIMAWVGVIQGNYLIDTLPATGFYLLMLGGLVYMTGIIFYKAEGKIPYAHLFWHLFVMLGCILHYIVMVRFVF